MRVLIDTNILLDVAQQRAPYLTDSDRVLKWCEAHPGQALIAWHTVSNIYFILKKFRDDAFARQFIAAMLATLEVAETGTASAKYALRLPYADFEDALQSAAAVQAGVDYIITRNIPDYQNSPIPAILPANCLAQAPA